jgi:hypothetical protein
MYYKLIVEREEEKGPTIELVGLKHQMEVMRDIAIKEMEDPAMTTGVTKVYKLESYPHNLISFTPKLMILGSGRSGTTFLVKMFTRLGFFTGFVPYKEAENKNTRGGSEFGVYSLGNKGTPKEIFEEFNQAPFIMKSPMYSWYLKYIVFGCKVLVGHVIIPVRDHREVTNSRIGENLLWDKIPPDYDSQLIANDTALGRTVETCVLAGIPMTFIRFPDIVKNVDYCGAKIQEACMTFGVHIDTLDFREEFAKLADPTMIKYGNHNQNT